MINVESVAVKKATRHLARAKKRTITYINWSIAKQNNSYLTTCFSTVETIMQRISAFG